jgi:hypothetical protein
MYERLKQPQVKQLDYNVYVRIGDTDSQSLIAWSPVVDGNHIVELQSPEQLHKLQPEFSGHSRVFTNYDGPLFKSAELSNYELLKPFPGSETATKLPTDIQSLLGWKKKDTGFPGAFPPCPYK